MEELLIKDNQDISLNESEVLEGAANSVRAIADKLLKTKAYYNALLAGSVMRYLEEKGLLRGEVVNMHSSSKMLVDFEVADIQLPNLHIDVRGVFDENEIFIPKKHFENKILPDIYLVVKLDEDLTRGTLLGFVEPARINKENQNEEYYFVNKSALTSPAKLAELIQSSPLKQQYMLSETAEAAVEKLIMLFMDCDIDAQKLEKLLDYLKNSVIAREKLVEFENFERLSYMALQEFKNLDVENNDFTKYIKTLVATDEFGEFSEGSDDFGGLFNEGSKPATGLFIDEVEEVQEVAQSVAEEVVVEPVVDEEDLPLTKAVQNEVEEDVEDEAVEEVQPEIVMDEFSAFETVDEFDMPDEFSDEEEVLEPEEVVEALEEVEETQEDVVEDLFEEPVVDEQEVLTEIDEPEEFSDDLVLEGLAEDVVADEPVIEEVGEAEPVVEVESAITEEDIANVSETLNEPVTGEDLEFHVEGLESIGEELAMEEEVSLSEDNFEEVSLDMPVLAEEDIVTSTEPKTEPQEVDVEQALGLDDVNLDAETVVGLAEGVLNIDNLEEVEAPVEETQEVFEAPTDDIGIMPDIDLFAPDESDEILFPDLVESVSNQQVDDAIEQSEREEVAQESRTVTPNADLDILMGSQDQADANDLSLAELLSIEDDLTATDATEDVATVEFVNEDVSEEPQIISPEEFEIDDEDEDEQPEPEPTLASATRELEELSKDLNGDQTPVVKANVQNADSNEDEDLSTFAFAVDTKSSGLNKKILVPVAALITILGLAGAGAWYFLSNKSTGSTLEVENFDNENGATFDLNDFSATTTKESDTTLDIQLESDVAAKKTPTDADVEAQVPSALPSESSDSEQLTLQNIKKDFSQPNTYLSVSKVVWDVHEYLTYNDDFNTYLQTLGSTIKLNLSSDLLLISENTMFDKVKVKIQLKDSGKKYSAEIVLGCGTQSVDDLVLQSVKSTLNLLKPPVNSLETADEDLYITIYL